MKNINKRKTQSIIGRTKTLPPGSASQYRLGVFSCANMPFGWFHAYAHAVAEKYRFYSYGDACLLYRAVP